jgi:pimeloyl-ACP methyl ester carboxylesterase
MKKIILLSVLFVSSLISAQVKMNFNFTTPYGNNSKVGKYAELNGAKIYYEEYGQGEPMLLIHGNGSSIKDMGNQIDYFKSKYHIIVADNRGHGKSELKTDSLTYTQITKDWEALVQHLKLKPVIIIGWSDGGIIALKLGISNKIKIKKIVAMGANLRPDTSAVYEWAVNDVKKSRKKINEQIALGVNDKRLLIAKQHLGLLIDQPNIPIADLSKIKAPVLVIAGDKDIIKETHTVEIYQHIPKAQLCIMPGETHYAPASSPALFNEIVNRFVTAPFTRPDSDWTKW